MSLHFHHFPQAVLPEKPQHLGNQSLLASHLPPWPASLEDGDLNLVQSPAFCPMHQVWPRVSYDQSPTSLDVDRDLVAVSSWLCLVKTLQLPVPIHQTLDASVSLS